MKLARQSLWESLAHLSFMLTDWLFSAYHFYFLYHIDIFIHYYYYEVTNMYELSFNAGEKTKIDGRERRAAVGGLVVIQNALKYEFEIKFCKRFIILC